MRNRDLQFGMQIGRSQIPNGSSFCTARTMISFGLHGRNETIATPRQSFDVTWTRCRITQYLAQLIYSRVQAVVKIHKCVGRPEFLADLFACDHIAGSLQQQREHAERLLLQTQLRSILAQFPRCEIELEDAEPRDSDCGITLRIGHKHGTAKTTRSVAPSRIAEACARRTILAW